MSVTLSKPIKRGDQEIKTIAITDTIKQAGSLRGLKLVDVLNFDYDAVSTLLTRTTSPQLTAVEISTMATGDFTALCEEITPFLTKAEPSAVTEAATASK
ncbi:phage tail assembly protein [Klebsiella pneumoniae]|uniref:phage tail assembly protein n=1 Tax=Klebsiella pneumoniae TaxID=573 RepID=UPI000E2C9673|nr:phage tail assembly protein [Klebsiella pneumoniae]SYU60352.1 Tail protein [Klebsiella pneumoniae]